MLTPLAALGWRPSSRTISVTPRSRIAWELWGNDCRAARRWCLSALKRCRAHGSVFALTGLSAAERAVVEQRSRTLKMGPSALNDLPIEGMRQLAERFRPEPSVRFDLDPATTPSTTGELLGEWAVSRSLQEPPLLDRVHHSRDGSGVILCPWPFSAPRAGTPPALGWGVRVRPCLQPFFNPVKGLPEEIDRSQ